MFAMFSDTEHFAIIYHKGIFEADVFLSLSLFFSFAAVIFGVATVYSSEVERRLNWIECCMSNFNNNLF